jgi:RND family efflux transporter MFP subunit
MPDDGRSQSAHEDAARPLVNHRGTPKPRRVKTAAVSLSLLAAVAAAYGIVSRQGAEARLAKWTDNQAQPVVAIVHPSASDAPRTLALPGNVDAFYEAPIYARVSGYLHAWMQDIGGHVKAGQTLATIDTPDLDQQMTQAQADMETAKANLALAELTAKRWHALLSSNAVSVQSADEKEGTALAQRAMLNAGQAKVDQLRAMESFKRLAAPFDGIVTARNTDVGALVNAGSGAPTPLFKIADMHEMRVYVRVPQAYASELKIGMQAILTEPQYPGTKFLAHLVTTSQSVTADSRTVLVELLAPNPDGKLWAGTYAEVTFELPGDAEMLRVPASALIFRSNGAQLATVRPGGRILMKDVTIGRNLGTEIEIRSGVTSADAVVVSPPDTLEDGESVELAAGPSQEPEVPGDKE